MRRTENKKAEDEHGGRGEEGEESESTTAPNTINNW